MTTGVLAVGDSITKSCGFPAGNLPLASWAQWVARSIDEPVEIHATPGASSQQIRDKHLDALTGKHRLGLLYAGTNDILRGVPVDDFKGAFSALAARLAATCETVLTITPPLWVGRVPTVLPYGRRLRRVYAVGAAIRDVADQHGLLVAQAPELTGPRYVAADRVHPTAAGQLAFADAAVWKLREQGWTAELPTDLAGKPDRTSAHDWRVWSQSTVRAMGEAPLRQLVRSVRR